VGGNVVTAAAGNPRDGVLERGIRERLDLAAIPAHEMVVVLALRVGALETRDAVAEIHSLDETALGKAVERAVNARDPDAGSARPDGVVDLLRGRAAVLATQKLDHDPARAAAASALGAHPRERAFDPGFAHRR